LYPFYPIDIVNSFFPHYIGEIISKKTYSKKTLLKNNKIKRKSMTEIFEDTIRIHNSKKISTHNTMAK